MKFSIRTLIVEGVLGGAHAGMDRAEVRACLGEPDDWMEASEGPRVVHRAPIWRYGNFEVHFFPDDSVHMLFHDYLGESDAGTKRELDKWILGDAPVLRLEAVRGMLKQEGVEVEDANSRQGAPILRVKGGADLTFDDADGPWTWGAIVVDASAIHADETSAGWERVYSVPDWYDGPRRGIAKFEGKPHLFESEFADLDDTEDVFVLSPVDDETFGLALEDWQIWRRWQRAYHASETTMDTHPALPEDRQRWLELQALLVDAGITHAERDDEAPSRPIATLPTGIRVRAEFKPSEFDNGHASLRVRWTRL